MLKNIFKFISLFLAFLCIIFFYKKIVTNDNKLTEVATVEETYEASLPDDFHTFYDKYHTDSLFQLERTLFPLKGIAQSADTSKIAEEVMWLEKDWIIHRPFNDMNGTFERSFTNVGSIITEVISANGGMFTLEKRYAKLSNEWHLIYYQELLMDG